MDHMPPQGWSKAKQKLMIAHVKATPDVTWNMAVVDAKWLGKKNETKAIDKEP